MTDEEFDEALVASAFTLATSSGWGAVSPAAAAREAGLKLERARTRFPNAQAILLRFGQLADTQALTDALDSGPVRERLFDVVMRRFDALQQHRSGILALLDSLPLDPGTALVLAGATGNSMGWMLEAAGVPAAGWRGALASQGMVGVWLYTLRAWRSDESPDLSGTMAALDRALTRAEQVAGWLHHTPSAASEPEPQPKPFPEPDPQDEAALAAAISGAADSPPPDAGAVGTAPLPRRAANKVQSFLVLFFKKELFAFLPGQIRRM